MSIPYQYCRLTYTDDWLIFEDSPEDQAQQALMMNEDDIRGLNCDFNYNHYGIFYEKIEEETTAANKAADEAPVNENAADGAEAASTAAKRPEAAAQNIVGFQKIISE